MGNQEIVKHLRIFVNDEQDNWANKLSMTEFVANNNDFLSIKLSPFFASRGLYPWISFDIVNFSDTITHEQINKKKL